MSNNIPVYFRSVFSAAIVAAVILLPLNGHAQLYTWRDAQGNTVMKNAPPPWYNENNPPRGPRVQVLRNGQVVDDTAWPADRRQEGRNKDARDQAKRAESEAASPRKDASKASSKEDDD